jgi:phasin family protein
MFGAAQAITKLQYGFFQEGMKAAEGYFKADASAKKPEEFVAEAKAAAEKVISVAKEQQEVGMKAQKDVAELVSKRVAANIEEAKTFAA